MGSEEGLSYTGDHPFYYDPDFNKKKDEKDLDESLAEAIKNVVRVCGSMLLALIVTAILCYFLKW